MKLFNKIYIYCQYPLDYFFAYNIKLFFKKNGFNKINLIYSLNDYSNNYNWDYLIRDFDKKYKVPQIKIGGLKNRINLKGFIFFIFIGLPRLFFFIHKLKKISVQKKSLICTFGGQSIEKSVILSKKFYKEEIYTFLICDNLQGLNLNEFRYAFNESLYYNSYQYFISQKYISIYWFLQKHQKTSQREFFFNTKPTDYFYLGEYEFRSPKLKKNQLYWPAFNSKKNNHDYKKFDEIVLIGGMFHWEKLIYLDNFYLKFNKIINYIKINSNKKKLTYVIHPSEKFERKFELNHLNIDNFEIIDGESIENYILKNLNKKIIAMCVVSTAFYTLNQINVPCFNLYKMFNTSEIDLKLKERYDLRWKIYDKKFNFLNIDSFDNLKSILSGFDYPYKNYLINFEEIFRKKFLH